MIASLAIQAALAVNRTVFPRGKEQNPAKGQKLDEKTTIKISKKWNTKEPQKKKTRMSY